MSTPGRRKALRALAARKRGNARRLAAGKNPVMGGKTVSKKTFRAKTGQPTGKAANRQKVKAQRKK
jgi:hypothetical protein